MKYDKGRQIEMKNNKCFHIFKTVLFFLTTMLSMTSCAYFSADIPRFGGGELLDNEMISSIKSEIFSGNDISETETDKEGNTSQIIIDVRETTSQSELRTEAEPSSSATVETESICESLSYSEAEEETTLTDIAKTETETETVGNSTENKDPLTVYWTKSGETWHLSTQCSYLKKSKTVYSGYLEDAKAAKKSKLCSYCEKHYQD